VVPVLPCLVLPEVLERDTEATWNPVELGEKHVAGPLDACSHTRQQIGREIVHGHPGLPAAACLLAGSVAPGRSATRMQHEFRADPDAGQHLDERVDAEELRKGCYPDLAMSTRGRLSELIFLVEEALEGGFTARALGEPIFAEADSLATLYDMVRDAVRCHFEEDQHPRIIRLRFVREEIITA
jgi:hypothetical protein